MLQGPVSVHELKRKFGHISSDVVSYLHVHDIKIVAQPPFKNEGLALIINLAGLTKEMDFSIALRKMRNREEISV